MRSKPGTADLRRALHSLDPRTGRRKWTLEKLARRTGFSIGHIGNIINGHCPRDTKARRAVIEALGLS